MSKLKNKKKYYDKVMVKLKNSNLSSNKKNDIKPDILNKLKEVSDKIGKVVTCDEKILKKVKIYKQSQLLVELFKNNDEPINRYFLLFTSLYFMFDIYCKYNYKEHITYYVYTILFSLSILYFCKINWKTIATLISIFALVKYLFLNYQLSSYYGTSIYFDIYIVFISVMIFYFIFLIELFLILIYLITLLSSGLFHIAKSLYKEKIKKNVFMYAKIFSVLVLPAVPISCWNNILGIIYLITIIFIIIVGSIFVLIATMIKEDNNNYDWGLRLQESYIVYAVFKILDNVNIKISKLHENMTFMNDFSFLKFGRFSRIFFICLAMVWIGKTIGIMKFVDTYNYNINFYDKNNGYCSNLNDDDLTFKTESYDSTLLLSYIKRDDGYLLKEGDFVANIGRLKDKNPPKYYIYEMKCEHNYKK